MNSHTGASGPAQKSLAQNLLVRSLTFGPSKICLVVLLTMSGILNPNSLACCARPKENHIYMHIIYKYREGKVGK